MRIADLRIAARSDAVLDRLAQEAVGVQLEVERKLAAIGDPEISWRTETAETGFFRALKGKRRDVLVVTHSRLREYAVLISSRAHGTALHVAWMVYVTPRLLNDLRRAVGFGADPGDRFEIGAELDAFDLADLRAFTGITRLALKQAVRELTDREADVVGGLSAADPPDAE